MSAPISCPVMSSVSVYPLWIGCRHPAAYRLESPCLIPDCNLHGEPLHGGRTVEAVTYPRVLEDEVRIRRLGHGTTMDEHEHVLLDGLGGRGPAFDLIGAIFQL